MGPKRNSRSTTEADVSGRMDDDALALRIIELLNDDAVVSKLKNALYPQVLADKLDQQTAQIDRLLAQLTESKTRIEQLVNWKIRPIIPNSILGEPISSSLV